MRPVDAPCPEWIEIKLSLSGSPQRKQNGLSPSVESLFRLFVGADENPKRDPRLESRFHVSRGRNTEAASAVLRAGSAGSALASSKDTTNSGRHWTSSTSSPTNNNSSQHRQGPNTSTSSSSSRPDSTRSSSNAPQRHESEQSCPGSTNGDRKSSSGLSVVGVVHELVRRFPWLEDSLRRSLEALSLGVKWLDSLPRHACCTHSHSCLSYVLKVGLHPVRGFCLTSSR
ncbi:hypothetical protein EGW08_001517 [Elysia chlorotica]|uniref:Uncharacterized protein n=1 Tax=Elysia chlorotica TaxID=188477 RepID=A0A3S0ZZN5_ELYCH|nr:hypothetical protein EGW08_001517 [Elysia chlorotica]